MLLPEKADILLKKLREGGVQTDVIHWTLDGEPFINKNIDKICSLAIKHGWRKFIFSTNGFYCNLENIKKLPRINSKIEYTLAIDFCADKDLFENERGTKDSWEIVRENILNIVNDKRLDYIKLRITDISSFTIHENDELKKRLFALKDLFPKSDRLEFNTRIFHNATGFVSGILENKKKNNAKYNLCPYPWSSLVVASNGDIVACCRDLEHKTVLGNLFSENLIDIWNGARYQDFRKKLADENQQSIKACASCDLPYDQGKFSIIHIIKTAISRFGILK
jgi:radical SAM protein with 4Fe4S-binding SPASM domain